MKKSTFLGSVAVGSTPKQAVSNFYRSVTHGNQERRIMSFSGKEKTYSLMVSSGRTTIPFNPYSGRLNLVDTGVSGESVSKVLDLAPKDTKSLDAILMQCSGCKSFQVADNKHLAKKCVICSEDVEDLDQEEVEGMDFEVSDDGEELDQEEVEEENGDDDAYSEMEPEQEDDDDDDDEQEEVEDTLPDGPSEEYKEGLAAEEALEEEQEDSYDEEPEEAESDCEDYASMMDDAKEDDSEDEDMTEVTIETETDEEEDAVEQVLSSNSSGVRKQSKSGKTFRVVAGESVLRKISRALQGGRKRQSCATIETSTKKEARTVLATISGYKKSLTSVSQDSGTFKVYGPDAVLTQIQQDLSAYSDMEEEDAIVEEIDTDVVVEEATDMENVEVEAPDDEPVDEVDVEQEEEQVDMEDAEDTEEQVEEDVAVEEQADKEFAKDVEPVEQTMTEDQLVEVDLLEEGIDRKGTVATELVDFVFKAGGSVVGSSRWYAIINDTPVAYATHQSAGRNGEIFHDDKFRVAASAVVTQNGIYKGLKEMGFNGVAIKLPIAQVVEHKIAKAKRAAMVSAGNQLENFKKGINQALSTAAVGLNKGFFADTRSPIKAGLYTALSGLGVQNAEEVIDDVFSKYGEDYHKVLMEKASDLIEMPDAAFNEVSTAVAHATYQRTSAQSVSARLASHLTGGNVPQVVAQPQAPASMSSVMTDDAIAAQMKSVIGRFAKG